MVGGEEHFKNVCFGTFYSKNEEKSNRLLFIVTKNRGACAKCLTPVLVALYNISSCEVNGAIMSKFFLLHQFYLQKSYNKWLNID